MYIRRCFNNHELLCLIEILLEDSPPKKTFAYLRERISKGELVIMTKSDQCIVAYSNTLTFVDCQKDQVKAVNPTCIPYLLAVANSISRYNVYINKQDLLKKCVLLNVGDKVHVILEQYAIPSTAVIKYKGKLSRKRGIFFGVEILVSPFAYVAKVLCLHKIY